MNEQSLKLNPNLPDPKLQLHQTHLRVELLRVTAKSERRLHAFLEVGSWNALELSGPLGPSRKPVPRPGLSLRGGLLPSLGGATPELPEEEQEFLKSRPSRAVIGTFAAASGTAWP